MPSVNEETSGHSGLYQQWLKKNHSNNLATKLLHTTEECERLKRHQILHLPYKFMDISFNYYL